MNTATGYPPDRPQRSSFGWNKKLRKTDDFSSVFRFRRGCQCGLLDIQGAPNTLGFPRLGLIVSKKILRLAVERNRIKRILRESVRLQQQRLGGVDLVIRLRKRGDDADYRAECDALLLVLAERLTASHSKRNKRPPTN